MKLRDEIQLTVCACSLIHQLIESAAREHAARDQRRRADLEILLLELPDGTPEEICAVMAVTVKKKPTDRTSLSDIKRMLQESAEWAGRFVTD